MCLFVGVYSTLTSCSPLVSSMRTTTTTTKSWRSDTLIILPGWECHTGGSRSKPTVHRCSQSGRRLWVARQVHNHEPNGSVTVQQCQHGSGAVQIHSTMDRAVRPVGSVSRFQRHEVEVETVATIVKEVIVNEASEPVKGADVPGSEQCGSKWRGRPRLCSEHCVSASWRST